MFQHRPRAVRRPLRPPRPPRDHRRCNQRDPPPLAAIFQVVVQCHSERDQESVYRRMTAEGRKCRVLTL